MQLQERRTHIFGDLLQFPSTVAESQRRRHRGGGDDDNDDGDKAKAQVSLSSVGEDKAMLLGYSMMVFSIFMYLAVGIIVVRPCIQSDWGDATNCSLIQAEFLSESVQRGSSYPCLKVLVNITNGTSERTLYLRYDETALDLSPECFYTPKNHQKKSDMMKEAQAIKDHFSKWQGQTVMCHLSKWHYPDDAILTKKHNLHMALWCLMWPSLMLFGGALLVGLVMLTQYLANLCNQIIPEEEE